MGTDKTNHLVSYLCPSVFICGEILLFICDLCALHSQPGRGMRREASATGGGGVAGGVDSAGISGAVGAGRGSVLSSRRRESRGAAQGSGTPGAARPGGF